MSPPSPNPTSVFIWEDSSALEHSCWYCEMKSNSPKAVKNCYGIHSIPCVAYHTTMHAIGASHRCSGCIASREIHENRHREIAELVAEYHAAEIALEDPPVRRKALGVRVANMQLRNYVQVEQRPGGDEEERNEDAGMIFNQTRTSQMFSSENRGVPKLTKAEQRERKKAVKEKKSIEKAAKHEAQLVVQVTSGDIRKVENVLHGKEEKRRQTETHPLATDRTIDDVIARNLGYVKQIESHKMALYQSVKEGRKEDQERKRVRKQSIHGCADVDADLIIDAILDRLGINDMNDTADRKGKMTVKQHATPTKTGRRTISNSKSRIVMKLREAIKNDLEKHENELRQTYIRAGGFFRYAGKAVFERMTKIAEDIDLSTGEGWEQKFKRETMMAGRNQDTIEENEEAVEP